jgi:ATP-binding cassette, subfamily B, bacterial PglK
MSLLRRARRLILSAMGIPAGIGILFSPKARRRLGLALAGSLCVALMEMLAVVMILPLMQLLTGASTQTGVLEQLSDFFGTDSDQALAITLASVVFLGFLAKALLTIVFRWWILGTLMRQEVETSTRMLRYYLLSPYELHLKRHTGEILRSLNEAVTQVYTFAIGGSLAALSDLTTIAFVTLALLVLQPVPTISLIVYFAIAAWVFQRVLRPRAAEAQALLFESNLSVYRSSTEALGGVKEIKLRGSHEFFLDRYRGGRHDLGRATRSRVFFIELPKHVMEIVFILGVGIMTIIVFRGEPSAQALSLLALFAAAGFRMLPNIVRALGSLTMVRSSRQAVDMVLDDYRDAVLFTDTYESRPRLPIQRDLVVENVTFRYADGPEVLSGVDLTIPRGTSLALVGGSGAGKTTLVDLLAGFHPPTAGRILRDGVDISTDLVGWQAGVAIVPQTVFLTDGSLRENIAFGVPDEEVDEQHLWEVVDRAQLRELVEQLPLGIDSLVGESGDHLSGGQRQRIGVARALYVDPSFLILDEATSALDNETERRVTETVDSLSGIVTSVIVAHRLSTVKHCDQLAFLSNGRVVATGTFDEVRAASPEFERLVRLGNLVTS